MSKAEERALEKYPLMADDDEEGLEALKYIGIECECASVFNEVQEAKQAYFIEGYHQAEKDLELSWEDIIIIHRQIKDAMNFHLHEFQSIEGQEKIYKEVLRRFNEEKERTCI